MEGGFIDRYMQRWVDGHMERRQHGNKTQQFLHLSECVRSNPTPLQKKCIQKWTNLTVVSEAWQLWVTETCKCVKVTVTCDSCASQNVFFWWYETHIFGSKTWEDGLKNTGNHGTPNNRKNDWNDCLVQRPRNHSILWKIQAKMKHGDANTDHPGPVQNRNNIFFT